MSRREGVKEVQENAGQGVGFFRKGGGWTNDLQVLPGLTVCESIHL